MLDTAVMLGAVPSRFAERTDLDDLARYFAMARGLAGWESAVLAMEMTEWFDTNYHYIVPEFEPAQNLRLASTKPIDEFIEVKEFGIITRPTPCEWSTRSRGRDVPWSASSPMESGALSATSLS